MIPITFQSILCTIGLHRFIYKVSPYENDYRSEMININYELNPTIKTCMHCHTTREKIYHCLGSNPLKHHIYWTKK